MTKKSSFVNNLVLADPSLNFVQKSELNSFVNRLPASQKNELAGLLRAAGGASVGAIVAKYLLKRGFTGVILMSIAGGVIGNMLGGNKNKNHLTQTDFFGRPRLI